MENKDDTPKQWSGSLSPSEFFAEFNVLPERKKIEMFFDYFDKFFQAGLGRLSSGISPAAMQMDIFSWLAQLAQSPGHIAKLGSYPMLHYFECLNDLLVGNEDKCTINDMRFKSESWNYLPWRLNAMAFLHAEDWWKQATTAVEGLPKRSERSVSFLARQIMDAFSPSNFVWTNPDLFYETIKSGGFNLVRGSELAIEHSLRRMTGAPPPGADHFRPGKEVAVTPGRVVFKDRLIELIQYEPQTKTVYREPVLIVPAWIMKYYILDLSPNNSLVRWLVSQGHTVFMVSWRNPDEKDRGLGMDDYFRLGSMAAIDKVSEIFPGRKINLMGYCLGGTLSILTAAAMARHEDDRLNSLILLAAQADFSEAGELMLFISESELAFLKNMMWEQGYLDTSQMAGAFQLLRTYDMIWSKMVQDYMHGREKGTIDLLAWNADTTRMPYRMHSEYLEKLFLNNDLAKGRFCLDGHHIAAENIKVPAYVVSTEKDHVAPWHSVYKLHLMLGGPITFVLTNGGHNAGIVSEPGHPRRYYRIKRQSKEQAYMNPDDWFAEAKKHDGSWWPSLHHWLVRHSSGRRVKAPELNKHLPAAPGHYVFQK